MKNRITMSADIIWRRIGDDIAVIMIKDDGHSLHILNKTAAHIWEMCNGNYDPDEIATSLCERFDTTLEETRVDVYDTLHTLAGVNLLKWDEGVPAS
jgi:hypothetical protein